MEKVKKKRMSFLRIIAGMLILFGIVLLVYPIVGNVIANRERSKAASHYDTSIKQLSQAQIEDQIALAKQYNQYIFDREQGRLGHEVKYQDVMTLDPVMGTIDIPAIDVKALPFYKGTDYGTLDKGIGHFKPSAIPVGGENTRSVLSGHSGMKNQVLFTDIKNLKVGDLFFINVLGKKLAYQIDSFEEVLPQEVDKVKVIPGEDRVTLVTCTPPGINTYRLLVNGKRIPYKANMEKTQVKRNLWTYQNVVISSLSLCGILFLVLFILYRLFKRQSQSADQTKADKAKKRLAGLILTIRGLFVLLVLAMLSVLALAFYGYRQMSQQQGLPTIKVGRQSELSAYNPDKILKGRYNENEIASVNVNNFSEAKEKLQETVNKSGIGLVTIPSQGVELPILAGMTQDNLLTGAATYRRDQTMGQDNYVLLSHNIWNAFSNGNVDVLFNRIANLQDGDDIVLTDFTTSYTYQVYRNEVIKDTQVEVVDHIKQTEVPILTLLRCEGNVGTRYRRLVQARLVKKTPLSEQNAQALGIDMSGDIKDGQVIHTAPLNPFVVICMTLAAHILSDPLQVAIPIVLLLVSPIIFLNLI